MSDDREHDAERLIDVVLAEQFGRDDAEAIAARVLASSDAERGAALRRIEAPAGHAARARRPWLQAAVVLLGVAVVTTMLLWQPAERQRPLRAPQDPIAGPRIEPRDIAHFVALVGKARALRLERSDTIGATQIHDASGSYSQLDLVRWPEVLRIDGERLAAWQSAIATSSAHVQQFNSTDAVLHAVFEQPDGTQLTAFLSVGDPTFVDPCIKLGMIVPDERLGDLLRAANAELERQHHLARGVARNAEELAALPAASPRIECPVLADGSLGKQLRRFTALQTLVVRAGEDGRSVDDALLDELQALRSVTTLDLPADALTDASCARFGGLPALRELTLRKGRGLTAEGMAALARLRALQVLRLVDVDLGEHGELLARLPSFVALRELALRSKSLRGEHLAPLLQTRLQKLVLVDAPLRGHELTPLAGLPSLRELEFVGQSLDDDQVEDLGKLQNLTRLRFHNARLTAEGLAQLRRVLPRCTIEGTPESTLFDTATWFAR